MNDKLKKIFLIAIAVFAVIFIFLFMMVACKKKYSPKELELKIASSARSYYERHRNELPEDGNSMVISLNDLVTKGIIKELEDILEEDTVCSGSLVIENNNNYYMYSPNLACTAGQDSYISLNLKDTLMENIVTSGNGLYYLYNEYYYRGDNVDNYLIFDGLLWRITKINSDNSIRIIQETRNSNTVWDNRHNLDKKSKSGYNDLIYNNINSRIKDTLDNYYETEKVLSNEAKGLIKKTNLCIGKRNETDAIVDGSLECSVTIPDQYLGLLQANEFMIASLDENCNETKAISCKNYNYLADLDRSYWTLTADSTNDYKVFKISDRLASTSASSSAMARLVINISDSTNVTGTGTKDDPYIVVGFDSNIKKLF